MTWNLRDAKITTILQLWWGPAPDGRLLDQTVVGPGSHTGTLAPWQALATDTYTVVVDPVGTATGELELTLTGASQPAV